MKKIAVFGSINIDYFVESQQLPNAGETIYGEEFFLSFGGKGANQAVAAARLGGEVTLFGSIGNDAQKDLLLSHFEKEMVNSQHLNIVEGLSTGAAFIQLHQGDNRIIIVPGANQATNHDYMTRCLDALLAHDIFVFQLEVPLETVVELIGILHQHKKTIILDPAPMQALPLELIEKVTYLTPNEHEVSTIIEDSAQLDHEMKHYANKLLVTFGADGVKYHDGHQLVTIPSRKVNVVDTTGAGDTFSGAFAVALSEGKSLKECVKFGSLAGSLSVTKKGAQSGMPLRTEIDTYLTEVDAK